MEDKSCALSFLFFDKKIRFDHFCKALERSHPAERKEPVEDDTNPNSVAKII